MNKITEEKLHNIIQEVLRVDVTDTLSLDTTSGWDSLRHIQLLAKIEQVFEIEIVFRDAMAMTDIISIRKILQKYVRGK